MTISSGSVTAYRFGAFRFITAGGILERNGKRTPLTPKVADMLDVFLKNAGRVVTKKQLLEQVWPNLFVVDSGITRNISVLRKALEGGLPEGATLETIPRRGYRLMAEITTEMDYGHATTAPQARPMEWTLAQFPGFLPRSSTAALGTVQSA